ncbi:MAG: DoxX family membrane protein [Flavobacteriaceae bacterium]|nr:DoxX family membrane protein [Flavobacteriaceae bacterium]
MNKAQLIIRILFGLILVIFGSNKFLHFMPIPPMPEAAGAFMGALVDSGYLMTLVALVEIVAGVSILINKYKTLALVILLPVILNAFLFHLFLDLSGIAGSAVALMMKMFLMYANKESYRSLLKA